MSFSATRKSPLHDTAVLEEAEILASQINVLYRSVPLSTLASLGAAAVLVVALWNALPAQTAIIWFALVCAHQAIRHIFYRRYMRSQSTKPLAASAQLWANTFLISVTIAGLIWGSAGMLLFVPDSMGHQAILMAVFYGVCAASPVALAPYGPAFYCFVCAAMPLLLLRLVWEGQEAHFYMAGAGLLLWFWSMLWARNISELVRKSIIVQHKNDALIAALSEQKALAEQSRQAAETANRAKSQFLAAASHDLRQPLHALGLFAAALSGKTLTPDVQNLVGSINLSIEALETLFNELLDISKLEAGVIHPCINSIPLAMLLKRLEADYRVAAVAKELRLSIRESREWVMSDPVLLERILRNLLENAIRYTTSGGIVLGCRRRGEQIRIEVWDSGIGIPKTEQEKIFEDFYQIGNTERSGKKGLGLGLAIIRRLAHLLQHRIELRSSPGRGSVFSVSLPRGQRIEHVAAPLVAPSQSLSGKLLVVIDDEASILQGMQALLESWQGETILAVSGAAALDELGKRERYPDLILADYRLRDGETGLQAIAQLRSELGIDIPAIVLTGSTAVELAQEIAAAGFATLYKPVVPALLLEAVNKSLASKINLGTA